jgi:excisionase family DNA binding protein
MIKLYTVNELAQVLKVSVRTLRREMDEGELKFIKIRGRIRIREEDVQAYLAQKGIAEIRPEAHAGGQP